MTTTAQATSAARRLARLAAVQQTGPDACPYPPGSTGPASAGRRAWLDEYRRLRPQDFPLVDFGDQVTAAAFSPGNPAGTDAPATVEPDLFATGGDQ